MKAALVNTYDAPPIYTDFDTPTAGEGEQLVTVAAAGLHQIVKGIANGSHYMSSGELPFIPGVDGVGRLSDGTRIYFGGARFPYGTMCEQTVIGKALVVPLPDGIEDALAAGIANPGMSSWVALDRGRFAAGETVFILGATGTSGQLAVQIAKARGARHIIAAGRNPEALEKLKSLGADTVISLQQDRDALIAAFRNAFAEHGVDVVLDYLWGPPAESVLAAISQKGAVKSGADGVLQEAGGSRLFKIEAAVDRTAYVNEQSEIKRQIGFAAEVEDGLRRFVVVEDREVGLRQVANKLAVLVGRDEEQVHFVDALVQRDDAGLRIVRTSGH